MDRRPFVAVSLLSILGACSGAARPPASKPAPPPVSERIRPLHDHMQEHFVRMDLMQKALIAGDLDRVRQEATWLLERPEPAGMPATWTPFVLEMMDAAAEVKGASDPLRAARGVARMGAACGRCHRAQGLKLGLTWDQAPRESMDPRIHMLRHQWATERFWDGLVSADDRGWQAGASVFFEASLHSDEMTAGEQIDPHVQMLADRLHDFGQQAERATAVEARVTLFARLMGTCARCHQEAQRGPASPPRID